GHEKARAEPAGGLAEDHHLRAISAERADVRLNPLERGDLIERAVVARRSVLVFSVERRVREESELPQTVIDRDNDDVVLLGELLAVVEVALRSIEGVVVRRAEQVRAAVHEEEHRTRPARGLGWGPHVQEEAVFVAVALTGGPVLRAAVAEVSRV